MAEFYIPDELDWKQQELLLDRQDCEEDLYTFLQHSWKYIDASTFTPGWPIEAVSEHLGAVVDGEIKRLIMAKVSSEDIKKKAREEGMTFLKEDGLNKVKSGMTTVEEVLRVTEEF